MEDKEEIINEETKATPPTPTKRQAYVDYMKSRNNDFDDSDEEGMYGDMLDYRKRNDESQEKMAEMLSSDPRLAQVLSDMANGKRGAAASFARYFGKDFLSAEEGSEEYEEIANAEKERKEELDAMNKRKSDYDANIEKSGEVLDAFAKEKGIDIDKFLDDAYSKLLEPIFMGAYTKDVLEMLNKALNYDKDVEDSFESGKVAGQNQNIAKLRDKNKGDGMPRLGTSGGGVAKPRKKAKIGPRMGGSVWDR